MIAPIFHPPTVLLRFSQPAFDAGRSSQCLGFTLRQILPPSSGGGLGVSSPVHARGTTAQASHLILTESLSSLLALRSFNPSDPLLQDILTRLTSLDLAGKSIQFCWVPSHVGITGNEFADAAARRAACAPCTPSLPLPARDFCPAVNVFVHSQWQRQWETQPNKLRELKPAIKP